MNWFRRLLSSLGIGKRRTGDDSDSGGATVQPTAENAPDATYEPLQGSDESVTEEVVEEPITENKEKTENMVTSSDMVALIASFEGLRLKAYLCQAGVPTIGYGSTYMKGKKVTLGMTCTKEEALEQFTLDLRKFEKDVTAAMSGVALLQRQFDAIVSFCYNCGTGGFRRSTLRKKIQANPYNYDGIAKEFSKWNKANGITSNGLKRRRSVEAAWYVYGRDYGNFIRDTMKWMYG